MTVVVAVVGGKKSGKTWAMEYLITRLSKLGFRVAAVKHIHEEGVTIDTAGKDTWRFAKAGANIVLSASPDELALIRKGKMHYGNLDMLLRYLEGEELDYILIEGFHSLVAKRRDVYKIITARDPDDLNRLLIGTEPPILAATGVVGAAANRSEASSIPIIDLTSNGESLLNIVKALASRVQDS